MRKRGSKVSFSIPAEILEDTLLSKISFSREERMKKRWTLSLLSREKKAIEKEITNMPNIIHILENLNI